MLGESTTIPAHSQHDTSVPANASRRSVIPPALSTRYEEIAYVGEGGMGTVYRGRDPRLGRTVALKLIKSDSPAVWQRFIQEAKSQARIQHACVCPVYEAGQADGEPYIAMQYISGEPLSRLKSRLSLEQKVKLIVDIALAVHEAHRLGLIHRDIKPGNILVEMQEDRAFKPYIMDFGLARDVEEKGQTVTGAIVGTIAYMPPEQANGETHSLDRRSDVYSLGATLYDILAGRPPFVADTHWKLLVMVGSDEPPRLGAVKPGIPFDLETIVMKCLERSPTRRYDSAKALADDLQRFLDGDPISARRASWGYVFWKKARKHKWLVVLALVSFVVASVLFGVWVHSRRQMAAQIELSRTFAEDVKTMEWYMRTAYAMPLHDIEKERDVIRGRLAIIEQRMSNAGAVGEGPGHYALGRGHLALGDITRAWLHLQKARAVGYASPELEYALGRVLGEMYRDELEAYKRISEGERRVAKLKEIKTTYLTPALEHLRAARAGVESPAYVEGLLAFYGENYNLAIEKARQAFAESPLMYEAKKLEADALQARGNAYRTDAAFDYEILMTHFGPATDAYAAAGDIARSDPEVLAADCALWQSVMLADGEAGKDPDASFQKANTACLRAIEASSKDPRARIHHAITHTFRVFRAAQGELKTSQPEQWIADAIRFAEAARDAAPDKSMAHYVVGSAYVSLAYYQVHRMQDPKVSTRRAIEAFEEAIRIEPGNSWAHLELGAAWIIELKSKAWREPVEDGTSNAAFQAANRAVLAAPQSPFMRDNKATLHELVGRAYMAEGRDPGEQFTRALELFEKVLKLNPKSWHPHNNIAEAYAFVAEYEVLSGGDPRASLQAAKEEAKRTVETGGGGAQTIDTAGFIRLVEAQYLLRERRDPMSAVTEARSAFRKASEFAPWKVLYTQNRILTEIIALRWALQQHEATAEMFDNAFAIAKLFLGRDIANPRFYVNIANLHALRATWFLDAKKNPNTDIEEGLALVAKAHELNPHHGEAHAIRGYLLWTKAMAAKDVPEKRAAATEAKEALTQAFKENALLEREYGSMLRGAGALL